MRHTNNIKGDYDAIKQKGKEDVERKREGITPVDDRITYTVCFIYAQDYRGNKLELGYCSYPSVDNHFLRVVFCSIVSLDTSQIT